MREEKRIGERTFVMNVGKSRNGKTRNDYVPHKVLQRMER